MFASWRPISPTFFHERQTPCSLLFRRFTVLKSQSICRAASKRSFAFRFGSSSHDESAWTDVPLRDRWSSGRSRQRSRLREWHPRVIRVVRHRWTVAIVWRVYLAVLVEVEDPCYLQKAATATLRKEGGKGRCNETRDKLFGDSLNNWWRYNQISRNFYDNNTVNVIFIRRFYLNLISLYILTLDEHILCIFF